MKELHTFDETFDSQKIFRVILEAMANPTRRLSVAEFIPKLFGSEPAMLAAAMTLLDNEVSFCADNAELAENTALLTHSPEVKCEDADFIFVTEPAGIKKAVEQAKCGTLSDPHRSATIIVKCGENATDSFELYGAGIDGTVKAELPNEVTAAINARDEQHYEYPQGIDFVFIDEKGGLFCIPRLTFRRAR